MAARLRDKAGAGLVGWWVAQSENDQCGHLLQIYPCYGRYVGVIYKASELADLKVEPLSLAIHPSGSRVWIGVLYQRGRVLGDGCVSGIRAVCLPPHLARGGREGLGNTRAQAWAASVPR